MWNSYYLRIQKVILVNLFSLLFLSCTLVSDRDNYIDFVKLSHGTFLGVEELIDSLDVPWDMQYCAANNSIFFTEIKGQLSKLDLATNNSKIIYDVPNVYHKRTLGLLGLAIHPDFKNKPYLYVCYTLQEGEKLYSELAQLTYEKDTIVNQKILLRIEGATGHNGARLIFDNKGYLYWATGDAHSEMYAQDSTSLNGKVLRMKDDGQVPADNPISGSYVYAWGFRNIQGIAITPKGNIITSEHGDAIEDELNWIRPLHNYGWKKIEGYQDLPEEIEYARLYHTTEPIKSWTPVIAPAAVHFPLFNTISEWKNSLLLGTLKDQSLHVVRLDDKQTSVLEERIYLKDHYGRIRAITSDAKGNIYIATSNRDWKKQIGFPLATDDRILKLSKIDFVPDKYLVENKVQTVDVTSGKSLYQAYCASCHKDDGMGQKGVFPPLHQTEWVKDEHKFVDVMLNGLSGKIKIDEVDYDQTMPSFAFLSNKEIVEIVTYVRSHFGNSYSAVDTMSIETKRKERVKNRNIK